MTSARAGLRVMIVENHRTVSEALSRILDGHMGAHVAAVTHDPDSALEVASRLSPDIALVDLDLSPTCHLVTRLALINPGMRVIALADRQTTDAGRLVDALASGAVGALYKDTSVEELDRALGSSSLSPVVAGEAVGVLLGSYLDSLASKRERDLATIMSLANALEAKDWTTGHHVHRVANLASACIEQIDPRLAENEDLTFGFLLHDVGKIGIPDRILSKPGRLDEAEWEIMRTHPELGVSILAPVELSDSTTDVVLYHHERWDGRGYPFGLRREDIPLGARVFTIVDAYDAMTSDRPYRKALQPEEVLRHIRSESGKAFDPDIVDIFVNLDLPEVSVA